MKRCISLLALLALGVGLSACDVITLTADQANAILTNPGAYYLNIHTAANPNGVARGQLTLAQ
jgi:CHRD domain